MKISKMSSGESIVFNYLTTHKYHFTYGSIPPFLKGLHSDFLIISSNHKSKVIEYDGAQHFYGWGNNKRSRRRSLCKINSNDRAKNELCVSNNISLLRLEDMKSLSTSNYALAILRINKILNQELPINAPGIHIRYVSLSLNRLNKHCKWNKSTKKSIKTRRERKYAQKLNRLEKVQDRSSKIKNHFYKKAKQRKILLNDVVQFVETKKYISTTELQLRFSIGYIRADRLMSILENKHIIGNKQHGNRPRAVIRRISNNSPTSLSFLYRRDIPFVKDFIIHKNKYKYISVSKLQELYQIGYTRARRIMNYLIQKNIVSSKKSKNLRKTILK